MFTKKELEKEFFDRIPKARRINPFFRSIFEFMYKAHISAHAGKKLLNIYASKDFSGERGEVYKEKFFNECEYEEIDFWEDNFIYKGEKSKEKLSMPFLNNSFDILVTTKYIMEHISEPQKAIREFFRVLRPGGEAFVVAAHVRRQHQKPYDYFRYTEFILEKFAKEAGFNSVSIGYTNGAMGTFGEYSYFLQRGLGLPKFIEKLFDFIHYWVVQPIFFFLDRFDNGYGRDFTQYFLVYLKK